MADVVQFVLNGQYMYLSSVVPALKAGTYFVLCRYSTFPGAGKFCDAVAVRHATSGNASYCEAAGDSGNIVMALNFNAEETLDTGADTTWRWMVMRLGDAGATNTIMDVFQADPANVSGTIAITQTDTRNVANDPDRVMFAANTSFLGDMGGTIRYAWIFVIDRACTDQDVEDFCNDPTAAQADADCIFYNDCTSAASVGTDGSGTGNNATVNGTPTSISGDDPRPAAGGAMAGTSAGAATVSGTLAGSGALAGTSAGVASQTATLAGAGALVGTSAGVATVTGTLSGPGAMTATSAGAATVTGTLTGTGAMAATSAGTSTASGTLTATGALAGAAAGTSTATGTLHDASVVYEYAAHSSGRYFLRNGTPWWGNGEWAVQLFTQTLADAEDYLDSCVTHGINWIQVELITQQASQGFHSPLGGSGDYPFITKDGGGSYVGDIGTADLSTTKAAYFAHARAIVDLAAERNIRCSLMYMPLGFGGPAGNVDFCQDLLLTGNDTTKCATYGAFVATYFADAPNVTWFDGSDYGDGNGTPPSSTCKTRLQAIRDAMEAGGCLQLFAYDGQSPSLSSDQSTFGVLSHENGCYTYGDVFAGSGGANPTPTIAGGQGLRTYRQARAGWNYTPTAATQDRAGLSTPSALPTYLIETVFLNTIISSDYTGTAEEVRRAQMWAILSGCTAGLLWGDEHIWPFTDTVWQAALNTDGRNDMLRLSQLMAVVPWWKLVPSEQSGMAQLVVGSRGSQTGAPYDYISSAVASDGTLLLAYCPSDGGTGTQTFSVNLTEMAAGGCRLRWYDLTAGTYTAEASGVSNSETSFSVTTPGANDEGTNDWILVVDIDQGAIAGTAAGVATVSATLRGTGALAGTSAGVGSATGAISGFAPPGTAAGTCTVAGTLTGAGAMVGTSAGAASVTGRLRDVNAPLDNACYVANRRPRNFVTMYRSNG